MNCNTRNVGEGGGGFSGRRPERTKKKSAGSVRAPEFPAAVGRRSERESRRGKVPTLGRSGSDPGTEFPGPGRNNSQAKNRAPSGRRPGSE